MRSRSNSTEPAYRRKLIEVDLPLDDINRETANEPTTKSGHPWRLQHWWARRRLVACRAVIFASLVDDPSSCPDEFPTDDGQRAERERLHDIIRELVKWESTDESNPQARIILEKARQEIARSVARSNKETAPTGPAEVLRYLDEKALPIYDPFCGGGSIPLEAQRLGLRAVGSDLNPVAVLITKALIELPPKFANQPPVNPEADPMGITVGKGKNRTQVPWRGAAGLANDIRYYGRWMREEAFKRIGHLYPKIGLPDGTEATVVSWLWARTIPCSNPACGVRMPLVKTFQLSKRQCNEHWARPVPDQAAQTVSFVVQDNDHDVPAEGTVNRNGATCIACGGTVPLHYVREQAKAGNMGQQMTAIVAEGDRKRLFLSPTNEHIWAANNTVSQWRPSGRLPERALGFRVQAYGFTDWHQLFTERQLTALATFADLLPEARELLKQHQVDDEYANAVCTYLAIVIGKIADGGSSFTRWQGGGESVAGLFSRQAISMIWDFAETNPFSHSAKNWRDQVELVAKAVEILPADGHIGEVYQADATTTIHADAGPVIVTDPPYYDNIGYADLSDFFYVWLRPLLRGVYPDLFAGILTPKAEEMVANQFRFENHRQRFEHLMGETLKLIRERCTDEFPSCIFYAYKQQEEERSGGISTGWETMLMAVVNGGFEIVGTWPVRTEKPNRTRSLDSNALATSVVLVCRPRPADASVATRRQFLDALEGELPDALDHLTREGHIAPVDLAQAAIGPGMEIYSRYSRVETISGERVTVREALAAINRVIAEYDEQQQGDLDSETRFCLDWMKQYGYSDGAYGEAETLAQAKNVSIDALRDFRRLLTAEAGVVRLLPPDEFGPARQAGLGNMTAWEGCFRMAYHLTREDGGDIEGAALVAQAMAGRADSVESLARILYNYFDRKRDSQSAVMFNNLVTSWPKILTRMNVPTQLTLQ